MSSAPGATPGETSLSPASAGELVEKWRFPAADSGQQIGVVHATPVVVGGYVYFGTATDPTFYKLTPDGKVRWSYKNEAYAAATVVREPDEDDATFSSRRFGPAGNPIFASALVTKDSVFFGDVGRLVLCAGSGHRRRKMEGQHARGALPRRS